MARTWESSAPNLIIRLHARSGFGVFPAAYERKNPSKTSCQYSRTKSTSCSGMPSVLATDCASRRSFSYPQAAPDSSLSSQFRAMIPITSKPARFSVSAATAESTPPERPTTTVRRCDERDAVSPSVPSERIGELRRDVRRQAEAGARPRGSWKSIARPARTGKCAMSGSCRQSESPARAWSGSILCHTR